MGTDKTIEKIKSRFVWINRRKDVKKFVKCFDGQRVKTPKTYCKPKLMPLGPTRILTIVTTVMAESLTEKTKEQQTHSGNERLIYKTCKSTPNEGTCS